MLSRDLDLIISLSSKSGSDSVEVTSNVLSVFPSLNEAVKNGLLNILVEIKETIDTEAAAMRIEIIKNMSH